MAFCFGNFSNFASDVGENRTCCQMAEFNLQRELILAFKEAFTRILYYII